MICVRTVNERARERERREIKQLWRLRATCCQTVPSQTCRKLSFKGCVPPHHPPQKKCKNCTHTHTAGSYILYMCMCVSLCPPFFLTIFVAFSVNLLCHASKVQRAHASPDFVVQQRRSPSLSDPPPHLCWPLPCRPSACLLWLAGNAASFRIECTYF